MDLVLNKTHNIVEWSKVATDIQLMLHRTREHVQKSDLLVPTVISLLFLTAYWSMIYLDSSQPGVNPPSPFASIARKKFHAHKSAHFHLNYLLGAIISVFLFFGFYFHIF